MKTLDFNGEEWRTRFGTTRQDIFSREKNGLGKMFGSRAITKNFVVRI